MKPESVEFLETEIETALSERLAALARQDTLPKRPTRHTIQMMAKAAVAVYEASVEPPPRRQR